MGGIVCFFSLSFLYIIRWSMRVADACAILVGDFPSWIELSGVIVESQVGCGFNRSILKSLSTRISA